MSVRGAVAALVGVAAVAALLVALARWERGRHADVANAGLARVVEAAGGLGGDPAGFRMLEDFQCLVYERGGEAFALEYCVDYEGRVVEAIDRRDDVEIWSLREDPERSRVRLDRSEFEAEVVSMCDDCAAVFERARQPLGRAP